jgi:hypothetical protein
LGHSTTSGNISSPLSPTPSSPNPSTSLPPSDPSTVTPPTDHQLVVDLSHYSPLQNPLHQPPLQPALGLPTSSDDKTHHMVLRQSTMHRRQANTATSITKPLLQEPKTFSQANKHLEWRHVMHWELSALTQNKTWDLGPRPPNTNIIQNKWLFRVK